MNAHKDIQTAKHILIEYLWKKNTPTQSRDEILTEINLAFGKVPEGNQPLLAKMIHGWDWIDVRESDEHTERHPEHTFFWRQDGTDYSLCTLSSPAQYRHFVDFKGAMNETKNQRVQMALVGICDYILHQHDLKSANDQRQVRQTTLNCVMAL